MTETSLDSKLSQTRFFRRQQIFEITKDHDLLVVVKGPLKEESWKTPLREIDPDPVRARNVDLKPLILAVPFSLVALPAFGAAVYMLFLGDMESAFGYSIAAVAMGIFAIGFWSIFRSNCVNVLTFSGAGGLRLPLWFNNPTPETFDGFVHHFREAILAARTLKPDDATLAGEIQKLKELLDRGILDKDQFESAKNRLTGNEGARKIGF